MRRAATIGVGLGLGVLVLLIATARLTVDHLFDHQLLLLVGLALGLAGALAGHLTRGSLSGSGQFIGYATYIGADGFLRVVGALVCLAVGVTTAGWFGIALGIAGLMAVPVALSVQRPILEEGPESAVREISTALGWLMMASLMSFGIMNIGPVLVKLLAGESQNDAVGPLPAGPGDRPHPAVPVPGRAGRCCPSCRPWPAPASCARSPAACCACWPWWPPWR